jgi:hypothetical protein
MQSTEGGNHMSSSYAQYDDHMIVTRHLMEMPHGELHTRE